MEMRKTFPEYLEEREQLVKKISLELYEQVKGKGLSYHEFEWLIAEMQKIVKSETII